MSPDFLHSIALLFAMFLAYQVGRLVGQKRRPSWTTVTTSQHEFDNCEVCNGFVHFGICLRCGEQQ